MTSPVVRREACTKFIEHLRKENLTHIRDKHTLREIYNDEVRCPTWKVSFSTMLSTLKFQKKADEYKGSVTFTAFQGFHPLAVDQRLALSVHNRWQHGQQQNVRNGAQLRKPFDTDVWRCKICSVRCNSNKSFSQHMESKKHRQQALIKILKENRTTLIADKEEVEIIPTDSKDGSIYINVRKNVEKSINILVHNKKSASSAVDVVRCELLKRSKVFQLSDKYRITQMMQKVQLKPGSSYIINVTCKAGYFSRYRVPIAFEFERSETGQSFHIVRFLTVIMSSDITELLQPVTPYKKPPRVSRYKPRGNVVEGWPLPFDKDQLKQLMPLDHYKVPPNLRKISNKGNIDELTPYLEKALCVRNYRDKFAKLLHIEEIQMEVDIRRYDMNGVTMEKVGRHLKLEVPGLAENRPSVLKGDTIFVQVRTGDGPNDVENNLYKGYVHFIEMQHVLIGFSNQLLDTFIKGMKFDVQFTFNRLPLRLQHRAVEDVAEEELDFQNVLFPQQHTICTKPLLRQLSADIIIHDRKLQSNTEQVAAVKHILAGTSRPAPYLLFGPPGTGKTVTMVESIKQVYKHLPGSFILACAPSNSAADLIAHRLLKNSPIANSTILRLCAMSRSYTSVDTYLKEKKVCNYNDDKEVVLPSKEEIMKTRIVVATLVTAGRLVSADLPRDHFTHLFIDEAGYAVEPESVISVAGLLDPNNAKGGQLVLAGDPKQLGPVLRSPLAIKYGLEKSILERFMDDCSVYQREPNKPYNVNILTKLVRNYRSHPEILRLPNQMFYENELQVHADEILRNCFCQWSLLPRKNFPIIFHGVEGLDRREGQSPSFFNIEEVEIVWEYVKELMEKREGMKITQDHIGIISPYRRQVQKIKNVMRKKNLTNIKVGSVEEFQGEERLIIIISTVRSTSEENLRMDIDYKLGFLKNPKRFNVAITRTKALLIVIGNPFMLQKDQHWNHLLQYCHARNAYRGCDYKEDDDDEVEDLIQRFAAVNISPDAKDEGWEVVDESMVAQYNDPEWRGED